MSDEKIHSGFRLPQGLYYYLEFAEIQTHLCGQQGPAGAHQDPTILLVPLVYLAVDTWGFFPPCQALPGLWTLSRPFCSSTLDAFPWLILQVSVQEVLPRPPQTTHLRRQLPLYSPRLSPSLHLIEEMETLVADALISESMVRGTNDFLSGPSALFSHS